LITKITIHHEVSYSITTEPASGDNIWPNSAGRALERRLIATALLVQPALQGLSVPDIASAVSCSPECARPAGG